MPARGLPLRNQPEVLLKIDLTIQLKICSEADQALRLKKQIAEL